MVWYVLYLVIAFWVLLPYCIVKTSKNKKLMGSSALTGIAFTVFPLVIPEFLKLEQWISVSLVVYLIIFYLVAIFKRPLKKLPAKAQLARREFWQSYSLPSKIVIIVCFLSIAAIFISVPILSFVFKQMIGLNYFVWLMLTVVAFKIIWDNRFRKGNLLVGLCALIPVDFIAGSQHFSKIFPQLIALKESLAFSVLIGIYCTAILAWILVNRVGEIND